MLKVYPIGAKVIVNESAAIVTGITIRGNAHVTYEVVWWSGGSRYSQWLEPVEISDYNAVEPLTIGFAADDQQPQRPIIRPGRPLAGV